MNVPAVSLPVVMALLPVLAAGQHTVQSFTDIKGAQRSFALVRGGELEEMDGEWHSMPVLKQYVQTHSGTYIVFSDKGSLYRLDSASQVHQAEALIAPMHDLSLRQQALAKEQQPLARTQQALGTEQASAIDPQGKGQIGQAQGALGVQQGDIGQMQGEIGRQQGELGRSFFQQVQGMLTACLADQSCPRVSP